MRGVKRNPILDVFTLGRSMRRSPGFDHFENRAYLFQFVRIDAALQIEFKPAAQMREFVAGLAYARESCFVLGRKYEFLFNRLFKIQQSNGHARNAQLWVVRQRIRKYNPSVIFQFVMKRFAVKRRNPVRRDLF